MLWVVALLCWCCWLLPCQSTIVNPRTGEVGSSAFLRQVYAPSPRTEAPTNPNPGHYQVTEPTNFDFTTRSQPRVHYDPRILPQNRNVNLYRPSPNALLQWQNQLADEREFQLSRQQRLHRNLQQQAQQLAHQQRLQDQRHANLDSYRRGYNKKGFRNYENREDWGRRKEQHYGINDPRLRAGYQDFIRFFGDFSAGKGSFSNLGSNGRMDSLLSPGAGMSLRQGAYGMPLYAPTFDLDYNNYVVLR